MNSTEFFVKYSSRLACQIFIDAKNIDFAIAALKAPLLDGTLVKDVIAENAKSGDIECLAIVASYKNIAHMEDHPRIATFLHYWNAWRKRRLPSIITMMDRDLRVATHV